MSGMRISILIALAAAALAVPYVLPPYPLSLLTEIAIFTIFAMTIDLLAGFAGRVPLGHGAIFGISAYVLAYIVAIGGGSPWLGAAVGIAAATLTSIVFAVIAIRTSGVYFLLLTLAQGMIVWGICVRWTSVTGAENGIRGVTRPEWVADHVAFYYFVLLVAVIAAFAMWRFVNSPFGLTLKGIRESESRMRALGYNVPLHLLIGFTVSGFFAGIAGALYAFFNSFVSPANVSLTQSTEGLLMVIVGGAGTLFGSVIGSAAIILLENVVSLYTDRWAIALGLLFILTMIFAQDGIVGKARSLIAYAQRWRRRPS